MWFPFTNRKRGQSPLSSSLRHRFLSDSGHRFYLLYFIHFFLLRSSGTTVSRIDLLISVLFQSPDG
ncbi:hypothetical protein Csa_002061 [Cucumis sativus]|uniref:Uncharacterized protein n=1 Tax=Cucumis sativus TaxID=3659 RepID=A0A0A0L9X1_CUCSA|nr:hypothetical protein Csa_002061 [Cucumis sativus]